MSEVLSMHIFKGDKLMDIYNGEEEIKTGFDRLDNELRNYKVPSGADRDGDMLDKEWARDRNRTIENEIRELREILDYNSTELKPERVEGIEEEIKNLLEERDKNTYKYGLAGKQFNQKYKDKFLVDSEEWLNDNTIKPEVNDPLSRFRFITEEMLGLYSRKNADYGDSFTQSLDEDGLLVAKIRLKDKLNRFDSIIKNGGALVEDETIVDTLIDLANYSIMTVLWLEDNFPDLCNR